MSLMIRVMACKSEMSPDAPTTVKSPAGIKRSMSLKRASDPYEAIILALVLSSITFFY